MKKFYFLKVIKESIKDLRENISMYMQFEIIVKFLSGFIILPFMTAMINYFVARSKIGIVTNKNMLSFLFTVPGATLTLILFILSELMMIVEISGLITISKRCFLKKKVTTGEVLVRGIKDFPKIISVGGFQIFLYMLIIAPFIGMGMTSSLIKDIQIPDFLMSGVLDSTKLTAIYVLLSLIIFIISVRWIFSFHISIIEHKSFKESIKQSKEMTKKKFIKTVFYFAAFYLVVGLIAFLFTMLFLGITIFLAYSLGINSFVSKVILSSFSMIIYFVFMVLTMIAIPLNVIFITHLYYHYRVGGEKEIYEERELTIYEIKETTFLVKHKRKISIILFIGFVISSITMAAYMTDEESLKNEVKITAHRGSSIKAPENTIAAIKQAILDEADYAEIDIQETKDGKIVLLHDKDLKRVSGVNKNIWDLTYDELKNYDVGSYHSDEFKNERVPLLEDVIKLSKGKIKLNIEVKLNGHEKVMLKELVNIIEKNEFANECIVTSFDYGALSEIKKINKDIKVGYIMFVALGNVHQLNVDAYSIEASRLTVGFITKAHNLEREVHVWTVNDTDTLAEVQNMGVDNVITDNSGEFRKYMNEYNSKSEIDIFLEQLFLDIE